jgi:hypothetical protein
MPTNDAPQSCSLDAITLLRHIPHWAELLDRNGLPCPVWRNSTSTRFNEELRTGSHRIAGLRALATRDDICIWQSVSLHHGGFVAQTGIDGVRIRLGRNVVSLNQETAAFPENFPQVYPDTDVAQTLDVDARREIAARWVRENRRLRDIYEKVFAVEWYS